MATQAALLYQEAPVGAFLPNSAEKPTAMPNSTSANRAAITSLIDALLFIYLFFTLTLRNTVAMFGDGASVNKGCRTMFHWRVL